MNFSMSSQFGSKIGKNPGTRPTEGKLTYKTWEKYPTNLYSETPHQMRILKSHYLQLQCQNYNFSHVITVWVQNREKSGFDTYRGKNDT